MHSIYVFRHLWMLLSQSWGVLHGFEVLLWWVIIFYVNLGLVCGENVCSIRAWCLMGSWRLAVAEKESSWLALYFAGRIEGAVLLAETWRSRLIHRNLGAIAGCLQLWASFRATDVHSRSSCSNTCACLRTGCLRRHSLSLCVEVWPDLLSEEVVVVPVIYERYRAISTTSMQRPSTSPQRRVWHPSSLLSGVALRYFQLLLLQPLLHQVQRLHLIITQRVWWIRLPRLRHRLHMPLPYPRVLHLHQRLVSCTSTQHSIAILPYNALSQLLSLIGSTRIPQMAIQVLALPLGLKPLYLIDWYSILVLSLVNALHICL